MPRYRALITVGIITIALQIAWAFMLLTLLFMKRTSFPRLFVIYLIAAAVLTTVDTITANAIMPHLASASDIPDTVRPWISFLIWGLYIKQSQRVRDTFVVRAKSPVGPTTPLETGSTDPVV